MESLKKNSKLQRITRALEIPREIASNVPKITILGFDEMLIENYKSILEYEDVFIRINTHIGIIDISGIDLKLNQMTDDDIMISGKFDEIEFEEKFN